MAVEAITFYIVGKLFYVDFKIFFNILKYYLKKKMKTIVESVKNVELKKDCIFLPSII